MHFSFMNVVLSHSDHLHVSATRVAIFRVVGERVQCDGITAHLQSIILVQIRLHSKTEITYLLTPWSRVLLEKLAGLQLVKKFPAFYGTRRFITALTSVRHLSLS